MTPILLQDVRKHFGPTVAVDQVTLRIEAGELFFLLGPSGCGKTTLLRILAGFVRPDAGDIFFGDHRITDLPPRQRDAGMVFQTYALWPHLTVTQNVAYGLQVRGLNKTQIKVRVERSLKMVRMEGFGERRPNQLSGGQQQRVALARALVVEPRVLLLDEPLSNLDARLRDEMREEIRRLHEHTRLTMVYVTHDQKEALSLADRLAVMDRGRVVQIGKPAEVYNRPVNGFVAGFLGESNFIPGTVREITAERCCVDTPLGPLMGIAAKGDLAVGARVVCAIRPEAFTVGATGETSSSIQARVEHLTFLGGITYLHLRGTGDTPLAAVCLPHSAAGLGPGADVRLTVSAQDVVLLTDPSSLAVANRNDRSWPACYNPRR
jgi:iron(III) transport system ATP-binding protein